MEVPWFFNKTRLASLAFLMRVQKVLDSKETDLRKFVTSSLRPEFRRAPSEKAFLFVGLCSKGAECYSYLAVFGM